MLLASLIVLFAAGLVNFYFSTQILHRVSAAEIKVSFFEIRWQVHKNMRKYCELTRAETGRTGAAIYGYWVTVILMLASVMTLFAAAFS